jgi:pimeloyl-ACP methyl ester carboxylesterase
MLQFFIAVATASLLFSYGTIRAKDVVADSHSSSKIEEKYVSGGPSRPYFTTSSSTCDRKGNVCDIWYPSNIAGGSSRPVVLWANGTAEKPVEPKIYDYLLSHFASWGFVVIATRDFKTGYGDTVLDSLLYLRGIANDRSNILYNRVDFDRVGVAGHSQGATGAINAMLKSKGQIRTTVAFQLPQQRWCSPADLCVLTEDLRAASSGSIFYVGGTHDFIISPDTQWIGSDLNSLTAYYDATPQSLYKAKGLVRRANHNDLLGKPDCKSAEIGGPLTCTTGVSGYLGMPTAWLACQLQERVEACAAFRNELGELFSAPGWSGQVSNVP